MENAGSSAAETSTPASSSSRTRLLIVCGKGNNGGDSQSWQDICRRKVGISIFCFHSGKNSPPLKLKTIANAQRFSHIELIPAQELEGRLKKNGYDIIIEGIFGTSFSGDFQPKSPPSAMTQSFRRPESRPRYSHRPQLRHRRSRSRHIPRRP